MKKLFMLIVTVVLTIGLYSCGGSTPTETVDSFLAAVKTQDSDSVNAVYSGKSFDFAKEITDFDSDDKDLDKLTSKNLIPKILDFDYTLGNEKIKDDKATVDVTFTTYNVGAALTSFMTDYFSQVLTLAFSDASDEQMEKIAVTLYKSKLESMEKNYTDTVTVSLTKKDNSWVIDEFDEEGDFYNALLGGAVDAVKDLEDAYDFE